MLSSVPVSILAGTVLGFLSGLGVGGGSLLMLWLTAVLQTPQTTARGINLLFFLPAAAVSTLMNRKQGRISKPHALPAILAACITAGAAALAARFLDEACLKKLFGVLLLVIGVKEIRRDG